MGDREAKEAVREQFRRSLAMVRNAVESFPTAHWRQTGTFRPAGAALHIAETIEFYISGRSVQSFPWGRRFGVDWEGAPAASLPDKASVEVYLSDVEQQFDRWLENTNVYSPEQTYPWTGSTILERCLYVLRNTQHHLGELSLALKELGKEPPDWH